MAFWTILTCAKRVSLNRYLFSVLISIFIYNVFSSMAFSQENGSTESINDVKIKWIEHNQWNGAKVGFRSNNNCGAAGSSPHALLLPNHVGDAKGDMYRMLLSGFLAGRQIGLRLVAFREGGANHCSIKSVVLH